jgi:hypothetical protein
VTFFLEVDIRVLAYGLKGLLGKLHRADNTVNNNGTCHFLLLLSSSSLPDLSPKAVFRLSMAFHVSFLAV